MAKTRMPDTKFQEKHKKKENITNTMRERGKERFMALSILLVNSLISLNKLTAAISVLKVTLIAGKIIN